MKLLNFTNASRLHAYFVRNRINNAATARNQLHLPSVPAVSATRDALVFGRFLIAADCQMLFAGPEKLTQVAYEAATYTYASIIRQEGCSVEIEPEPTPEEIAQAEAARLDAAIQQFKVRANDAVTELLSVANMDGIPQMNAGLLLFEAVTHFGNPPAR